jgi:hypothetical protein
MYDGILTTRENIMRLVPAALMLSAVAVPAAAQSQVEDAARQLQDPIAQEAIAMAVSSIAAIVLDTRVGQLAQVLGPESDIRPSDTLRDVQRRKDPDFEAKLQDDTRRAVATAGSAAVGAAAMSGELQRTAERLQAAMAPLAGVLASQAEDYDDDY